MNTINIKGRHWQAFFITLLMATAVFLPFIIYDKGIFFFYGDFNVQQIPFYKLAHEAIRSGDIFWSWTTDLGANFIGSYSFYVLFSPFFWLTLPFPTEFVPYLIGPLLILKTACAALTSYFFFVRFVRDKYYAVLASILYAFSGFMVSNIFFNHFHEVVVFFPLLLVGLEKLVTEDKRGWFAFAVALNCLVNYWFFIGEVVFTILYVVVRSFSPNWQMTVKKFFWVAFEAVLGVLMALFLLLPSVMALTGNPRTTSDNFLMGWWFWVYDRQQRLPAILQSLFFMPELPSAPNFFPDHGAKWASMSAWLPMISTTGVIAYLMTAKKDWLKRILWICLFMALIPGLNSAFVLFNHSYYARWFYMPVLLMCLASVLMLERKSPNLLRGFKWTAGITALFVVAVGFTPQKIDGEIVIGLMDHVPKFWGYVAITVIGLALTFLLLRFCQQSPKYKKLLTISICSISVIYSITFIAMGKTRSDETRWVKDIALDGRYQLELPETEGEFARSDLYDSMDNLGMFWGLPNIQAFHSIVPTSLMEFYPSVGVKRDVSSKPGVEFYELRSLLSVKWFFTKEGEEGMELMPGYEFENNQLGYHVYRNTNYLPMGFGYEYCFDDVMFDDIPTNLRAKTMMHAIQLEDDAIRRNSDILVHMREVPYNRFDYDGFEEDVQERRALSAYSFEIDNHGFTAKSNLSQDTLMFFSVPYEKGWSATVNGEDAIVERANIGFMAVRVPAGEAEIRFNYNTPGLTLGIIISFIAFGIVLIYLYLYKRYGKKQVPVIDQGFGQISMDEYIDRYTLEYQQGKELAETVEEQTPEEPDKPDSLDKPDGGEPHE